MCKTCGCGEIRLKHGHDHDHAHPHTHPHKHPHARQMITAETRILTRNDELAEKNRKWLDKRGIVALNLISSPGSGKTMLLERTLERLSGRTKCAVITGDLCTDNDARRLAGKGAPVHQIETISACHLSAEQVAAALPKVIRKDTRLLFIENVGNLVCPAAFQLGEHFKVALLSVTEGEDKPVKYPSLFSIAPVVVLTKTDLIPHLDWKTPLFRRHLQSIHSGVYLFELSARTGNGMDAWIDYLEKLVK